MGCGGFVGEIVWLDVIVSGMLLKFWKYYCIKIFFWYFNLMDNKIIWGNLGRDLSLIIFFRFVIYILLVLGVR